MAKSAIVESDAPTEAELENLSEEERKAFLDDEADPDDKEAVAAAAAEAAEAAEKEAGKKDDAKSKEDDEAAAKVAADEAAAAAEKDKPGDEDAEAAAAAAKKVVDDAAEAAAPGVSAEFTPRYQAEAVENYDDKIKELAEKKSDLQTQYENGEITIPDMLAGRDEVEADIRELDKQQTKFEMSNEQAQQAGEQRWQWEQDRFFNSAVNKDYKDNPIMSAAIDSAVKTLANDKQYEDKPLSWYLEEADRQVRSLLIKGEKPAPVVVDIKPGDKNPDLSKIPPNLGDLPAAEVAETGVDDEFSKLDKLGGVELEYALAKLTPEESARYLKG